MALLWCLKTKHAEILIEACRVKIEASQAPIVADELLELLELVRATAARLAIPVASDD